MRRLLLSKPEESCIYFMRLTHRPGTSGNSWVFTPSTDGYCLAFIDITPYQGHILLYHIIQVDTIAPVSNNYPANWFTFVSDIGAITRKQYERNGRFVVSGMYSGLVPISGMYGVFDNQSYILDETTGEYIMKDGVFVAYNMNGMMII